MQPACRKKKTELAAKNKENSPVEAQKTKTAVNKPHQTEKKEKEVPVYTEYKSTGLSLKNINKKPEQAIQNGGQTTVVDDNKYPDLDFTPEQLEKAWLGFAATIQNDLPRMYQILKNKIPEIDNKTKLILKLDNELQKDEFLEKLGQNITLYLRKTLQNKLIEIFAEVLKPTEIKNVIYSATDKYNYLLEINNNLNLFKQAFNLDID